MTVITIREEGRIDTGFAANLKFDGGEYPVTITDPFTAKEEKELEWYFEEWVTFPFSDTVIAERAAASVKIYGESLFKQVFQTDFNAYSLYRQLRGNLSQVQIEIVAKTPEFHAIHWEALQDPDLSRPLAVDCVMLRKNVKPAPPVSANVQTSAVINLLVVVARPDEERDVGYRTISRPLLELIDNSNLRVNVELLRPGTYESLSKHLQEKGAGFYHIVHLDMHGAVLNYEQVQSPSKPERYFYKGRYGRGDLQPFDGVKAFVCFEGESQGKVDLVEASELAALLTGKGIPVCILNACQSGKQVKNSASEEGLSEDTRETSLGSRLMTAGMQMVVAMGYSVTVSAAKLMMSQLYQHLFDHKPMTEAIRLGRLELFNDKERKAYFNKYINLEDWLLPVVYSHQVVNFNLRQFTPEEEEKYYESVGSQYRFSLPEYGFIGRDLEILKIEKALLRHNVLLLQGMGGTGKTTLLNYLTEWWQRTHFVEDVFYFGYDQKAWTLTQILFDIGQKVYKEKFEQARFQVMSQPAQVGKLVAKLRGAAYAVILDNLESVTGQQLAIQNTLPEAEREQIRDFIGKLVGGKTRVVLGSRSREEWLQSQTFKQNIYELQGLDQEARTELAEKILERNVAAQLVDGIRQDADFEKLMKLLAGYPLAMEVVLTNLQRQSPQEILQGLQSADVNLDVVSEDKTKSILKCVEYSHSNLSPDAQKLLLCLAHFSGFILRTAIPQYIKELQKLETLNDYCFDKFDDAIQEAINWGLLSLIENNQNFLKIQPIFPYFLKTKLASVDKTIQAALQEGFKNYYIGLAENYKYLMDSKDAHKRELGISFCGWEYENLYHALQIYLQKQESISIYFCLFEYFDLISDNQSNLKLAEMVCQNLENYPPAFIQGELGYLIALAIGNLGNCQLMIKQYQQAKDSYEKTLEIYPTLVGIDERQKQLWQAGTYQNLGRVAQELREYEEAQRNYQQALNIFIEYKDRFSQASTYQQLGRVAQELREYEEARRNYQQALKIYIEDRDRFSQAGIYNQLGIVAQELRDFETAKENFEKALNIKIEYGDRYSQAITDYNLGIVAQQLHQYEKAKHDFQQALKITIEYGASEALPSEARYSQARIYDQLGAVAQELYEYEEAKRNYQQALNIYIEYSARYSQGKIYHQLGLLAVAEGNFSEAKANFQKALEIFVEYEDEYNAAMTRSILDILPD
ncbi:tetratricopeptide repeat protein [Nodularia harveyana UHCC-0300]|uniref:Tetratricopeptide repeat protein n=1 Tax=Nodularia harveyana UHCC-0300 TaxID=2974287 RepID=A0ABU5U9T7_9CYAN|nr:tetratricopeptide repeat protein [Nodularia harveyana]MEA5580283.1 tetratricopeptide repeat protein [Nodularia harveyana UHCC-0300]